MKMHFRDLCGKLVERDTDGMQVQIVSGGHKLILAPTRSGKSSILEAEAKRLGITLDELMERLEPTVEEKEKARIRQEEEDRRDAKRLDAVRQAYWEGTREDSSEFYVLSDAISGAGIVDSPNRDQQRALFGLLPQYIIGEGIAWGFSDTEVRGRIHEFVAENREAVVQAVVAATA